MPLNINPNYDSNNPTILLNTQIPALTEDADIQEALRLYHYGSTTPPALPSLINPESVAGYLKSLREDVTTLQDLGIGSSYSNTLPTNVPDGYVWVNSDSAAPIFNNILLSAFQPSAPTNDLAEGMLWVDSDSSPLELYVYDGTQWSPVTSGGGGSSYAAGAYALTDATGIDSITSAAGSAFVYSSSPTTPFGVNITTTSGYSKIRIRLSVGYYYANANPVYGPITISRIVNGNIATLTNVGAINIDRSEGDIYFEVVDTHGQTAGSVISYGLANATNIDTSAVITFTDPFSGTVPMTIQLEAEEVA